MTIINMSGGKPAKPIVVEAVEETPSTLPYTFLPKEGVDYLSSVTVGKDPNLVPGNVKKDVSIFGVEGTFEGSGGGIGPDTFVSDANWVAPIAYLIKGQTMWNEGTPVTIEELPDLMYYGFNTTFKCAVDNRSVLFSYRGFSTSNWPSYEYRKYVFEAQHLELKNIAVTAEEPRFFGSVPVSGLFGGKVIGAGDSIKLWMKLGIEALTPTGFDPNDVPVIGTLSFNSSNIRDAILTVDVPEITLYVRSDASSSTVTVNLVPYYGELIT